MYVKILPFTNLYLGFAGERSAYERPVDKAAPIELHSAPAILQEQTADT